MAVSSSPSLSSMPVAGDNFSTVFAMLKPQMSQLDGFLRQQLQAFEPEIRDMADYCIDTSGKRIRPALVFLSGWGQGSEASLELVRAAAVVEMVHLATLVHDDIMDEAQVRRSRLTAAKKYGPEAAVLLGDALFCHALNLATQFPTTEVCQAVSESTRKVCAGEIVQTLRRGTANITRSDYLRIIDLKTAELFRVSCHLGSRLAGFSRDLVEAAARFGRHLGIAYQIYDDLTDFFGDEKRIGKTLGTDLISGKVTLPLLVLLERLSAPDRQALIDQIEGRTPPQLAQCLSQLNEHGVFAVVAEAVQAELEQADHALAPYRNQPCTPYLLRLCEVLRHQMRGLEEAASKS